MMFGVFLETHTFPTIKTIKIVSYNGACGRSTETENETIELATHNQLTEKTKLLVIFYNLRLHVSDQK